jgi:hypothetical protein
MKPNENTLPETSWPTKAAPEAFWHAMKQTSRLDLKWPPKVMPERLRPKTAAKTELPNEDNA